MLVPLRLAAGERGGPPSTAGLLGCLAALEEMAAQPGWVEVGPSST